MLQRARGYDICKPHILKLKPGEQYVDNASLDAQDSGKWYESHIKALQTSLDEKRVAVDVTAIPIGLGRYLTCPQTRRELQAIKNHYNAEVFNFKDAELQQLDLVCYAIQIYRTTTSLSINWLDDLDDQLALLRETKNYEQQAAYELADGFPSGSVVAVWIEWDVKALNIADKAKWTDLEQHLLENGVRAAVLLIQPLKFDLCEILVKKDREDEIKLLFAGKVYAEFSKESGLVSACGYKESLRIVLNLYKSITETWSGQEVLVDNRIKQLEERLEVGVKEFVSSKI